MPFTLSHPAAVLPLLRHPFSAVALVAGAVAPDLPYFARSTPIPVSAQSWYEPFLNATTSHGLVGALTVSLPYGLALCGLFWVARRPVGALLSVPAVSRPAGAGGPAGRGGASGAGGPGGSAGRGRPGGSAGRGRPAGPSGAGAILRRGGWVLLSLLIGIATHLVWDSFTHSDGWVVTHVPALSSPLAGDLTWARALQHVSTVGGLLVIAVYLWRRRSRLLPRTVAGRRSAWRLLGIAAGVAAVGAAANTLEWWGSTDVSARDLIEGVLSDVATGAGAALIVALFLYVVAWWVTRAVVVARR